MTSIPISTCEIIKAAKGDEKTYQILLEKMKYNKQCGHWSQFPCNCDPECKPPTEDECDAFNKRVEDDLKDVKISSIGKKGIEGKEFRQGKNNKNIWQKKFCSNKNERKNKIHF